MTYVEWFHRSQLHGTITDDASYTTRPLNEAAYYRQTIPAPEPVTQQPEQSRDPGLFSHLLVGDGVFEL
ncbi:MAG: hypothetical protein ACXVJ7_19410 [Acidimicrobiia bacterium]